MPVEDSKLLGVCLQLFDKLSTAVSVGFLGASEQGPVAASVIGSIGAAPAMLLFFLLSCAFLYRLSELAKREPLYRWHLALFNTIFLAVCLNNAVVLAACLN
jgi:uncharacterized membrane protein